MKRLREKYPNTIFVGTVPAVKVAYDNNYKETVILSTPFTRKSKRLIELVHDFKNDNQNIYNISGENLANLIELDKKKEIRELLKRVLGEYTFADSIVLGCTHYSLIKDEFKKVLPNAALLDGCVGVSQEVKRQLEKHNLINEENKEGSLEIINNKDDALIKRSYEILEGE
jgi:glutamate racemase